MPEAAALQLTHLGRHRPKQQPLNLVSQSHQRQPSNPLLIGHPLKHQNPLKGHPRRKIHQRVRLGRQHQRRVIAVADQQEAEEGWSGRGHVAGREEAGEGPTGG